MQSGVKTTGVKTKGELTRERIIKATLDLIAEEGLRAVSTRNVAKRGEFRHSLITYYFSSIDNLLCEAFSSFETEELGSFGELLEDVNRLLENNDERSDLIEKIAEALVLFVSADQHPKRKRQIAIEHQFVFSATGSDELSRRVEHYNKRVFEATREIVERLGSDDVDVDAHTVISVFRYMELANATGGHISPEVAILMGAFTKLLRGVFPSAEC